MQRREFLALAATTLTKIDQPEKHYVGWPTLIRTRKGELLAAYSGGREAHVCPFGRVEFIRSADEGRTWSRPQVILDTPIDDRDAGITETAKGTLLVTTFTSLVYQTQKGYSQPHWQAAERALSQQQRQSLLGAWMLRSTDSGLTWSQPYRVPVTSPHGVIVLRNGRLLYPGKKYPDPLGAVGICESKDDGLSWRWLSTIPTRAGDDAKNYHELHGVEATNGHLIVHIRNHNEANRNETLQTESTDGGKTWSVPHPIGVWGLPSHLLRLTNGNLVMTYGYRRSPRGNHARLSTDHGRTWSEPVVLSDDGFGDLGYPSSVELPSGDLLALWYEVLERNQPASLRTARYRLP
jgi:sialidase-1